MFKFAEERPCDCCSDFETKLHRYRYIDEDRGIDTSAYICRLCLQELKQKKEKTGTPIYKNFGRSFLRR